MKRDPWVPFRVLVIGLALTGLVVATAASQPAVSRPISAELFVKQTFTYKSVDNIAIQADVFRLPGNERRPVLVWIHPGALIMGSRAMLPADERDPWLRAGFVVVAIDYRLAPETKLPEMLQDVEDAFRWVRVDGPALFGADPARIATVGASGGGYLALMAGARVQPRLKAVVSLYGYGDVAGAWYSQPSAFYLAQSRVTAEEARAAVGERAISEGSVRERNAFYVYCRQTGLWPQQVVGSNPTTDPAKFAPYSAEGLVTPDFPPTLLAHGDHDVDVPFEMSERMAAAFERHHVEHTFIRLDGLNYAFDVFDTYPPQGPPTGLANPKAVEAFDSVLRFLMRHTGAAPSPR